MMVTSYRFQLLCVLSIFCPVMGCPEKNLTGGYNYSSQLNSFTWIRLHLRFWRLGDDGLSVWMTGTITSIISVDQL